MSDLLERTLVRFRRRARREAGPSPDPESSSVAFRATVEERLRGLERQLDEVKGRVNGLIFLLTGAVAAQFVLRLVG